ncbi:MAG TPA: aminotransferase class I/II-fold pyridoxal phosphate-dependent enzyme [Microthrixaceae bacterium]|nr:aminotransferase class I/II-fold pyridoxal phosphate-dependent enzyme [Microthrixaceae bacterium]HNN38155.1 aminotransferase class I/II-fold pyridoxal phosphate-dependent enzyme [Microthrixaceae bacterium]
MSTSTAGGFVPPPYPYDRLADIVAVAAAHDGGAVDLSIGTPGDPPAPAVLDALASSGTERGYPPSIGTEALRAAVAEWFDRRFGVGVDPSDVGAAIGTKELVAGLPHWLRLRDPSRDTVLYPEVSYPSYAMGATLAGCRAVPVPMDDRWRLDLSHIDPADAARALCLWANTPGNPAGGLDDLAAVAEWGRRHRVPVFSDECYVEFTWSGPPARPGQAPGATVLSSGTEGVVAVHSLSKRSNLAGLRVGFYAGDPELVHYLQEVRKHAGFMVPGPAQAAAVVAVGDQRDVDVQRERYRTRLARMAGILERIGIAAPLPDGGFYLWVPAPEGDAWRLAQRLAAELGIVSSPGEFYGHAASGHVRLALVQPDEALDLLERRAGTRRA